MSSEEGGVFLHCENDECHVPYRVVGMDAMCHTAIPLAGSAAPSSFGPAGVTAPTSAVVIMHLEMNTQM